MSDAVERERDRRNGEFRRRVLAGAPLFGTFLGMGSPVSAELCGRAGLDWAVIDLEHGLGSEATLLPEILALELTQTTAIVRVETSFPLRISRTLDHGAAGIMVPQVRSAADAERVVRYVRYPPEGQRGVALTTRGADYGGLGHSALAPVNAALTTMIQIEHDDALAAADDIAAVDGVDVLFVGPSDLTHSMGIPGQFEHPRYLRGLEDVGRIARAAGKAAGVLIRTPDELALHQDLGYSVFILVSDGALLTGAVRSALASLRAGASAG